MDPSTWLACFAASWAISISPGPGAVAAMSAGLQQGFARGYWLSFGLILGPWSQLVLVGAGLGALIAASGTAFVAVRWLGVAYLFWLGISQWRSTAATLRAGSDGAPAASRAALLARGWALNTVNPKGTLFMLAVVPQFIDPARPLLSQYLVIAATLGFTDLVVNAGVHRLCGARAGGGQHTAPRVLAQPHFRQPVHRLGHPAGHREAR